MPTDELIDDISDGRKLPYHAADPEAICLDRSPPEPTAKRWSTRR
jgi:hypothetical protein